MTEKLHPFSSPAMVLQRCVECNRLLVPQTEIFPTAVLPQNVAPDIEERAVMQGQLIEYRAAIDEINTEILRLQGHRDTLKETVLKMENRLAPIHRVPDEILIEIWKHVLQLDIELSRDSMPEFPSTPPVFHQVSKTWRNIATTTPTLWRNIAISRQSPQHYVLSVLEWSWTVPLSVLTTIGNPDMPSLLTVAAHANRWKSADFWEPSKDIILALQMVERQFLTLEVLCLGSTLESDLDILHAFQHTPRLRKLILYEDWSIENLLVPWPQLTSLRLQGQLAVDCMEMLNVCTNLRECSLIIIEDISDLESLQASAVNLPYLIHLEVENGDSWDQADDHIHIFRLLMIPAIQRLEVITFHLKDWSLVIPRSLLSLEMRDGTFLLTDILELLQALPSLQELALVDCDHRDYESDYKGLIAGLILPTSQILLYLSQLKIVWDELEIDDEFGELVERMIRSRWHQGQERASDSASPAAGCLTSVILQNDGHYCHCGASRLTGLVEGGFDIKIFNSGKQVL